MPASTNWILERRNRLHIKCKFGIQRKKAKTKSPKRILEDFLIPVINRHADLGAQHQFLFRFININRELANLKPLL